MLCKYLQYGIGCNGPFCADDLYSEAVLAEDQYALYGSHKVTGRIPRSGSQMYDPTRSVIDFFCWLNENEKHENVAEPQEYHHAGGK